MAYMEQRTNSEQCGFTLIEMIVAIFLFSIVMVVATGTIVAIVGANRKAQAVKSVMNNVAFSLDSMTRSLRVGTGYDCVGQSSCASLGTDHISFKSVDGEQVDYQLDTVSKQIERAIEGGAYLPLTAPEVVIERLMFYVDGESTSDDQQPRIRIVVGGHAGEGRARTQFDVETMVSQRILDR